MKRRAGRYLNLQANYAWAKQLDNTGTTVNNALLDVQNLGRDRADGDYTRRQQLTVNGTYDLPFGHGRPFPGNTPAVADAVLAGCRLSGIMRYTTGRYFTPTFTANGGLSNNRPDVVYGVAANLPPDQRTPLRWFNPAAFAVVPAVDPILGTPRFGNAGRNTLDRAWSQHLETALPGAEECGQAVSGDPGLEALVEPFHAALG
ncbi:MAG: hypothetical protein ACJ746_03520 [Bryobacteraceae bacterium]